MKTRVQATLLLTCFLVPPLMADTFILKDGTKLNAKVLREDPTSYVLEVQVTKSIKDERTIAKADVAKVERDRPDLIAFEGIAALKEVPDLTTAPEYDQKIRAVEKFIKDFPASSKLEEARAIATQLRKEANEILAGGIKIGGEIVPAQQYQANAYELDASAQALRIRKQIDAKQFLPALRMFSEFEKNFLNTQAFKDLSPLAIQVMRSHVAETSQLLSTYDARIKEREVGLQRMPQSDRVAAENALSEENAQNEAQFKREKESQIGWVTVHPFLKESIDETLTFGKQEISRLSAPPSGTPVDAGKLYRDTLSMIQTKSGDANAVGNAINEVKNAQIPAKYIERLESAAKSADLAK